MTSDEERPPPDEEVPHRVRMGSAMYTGLLRDAWLLIAVFALVVVSMLAVKALCVVDRLLGTGMAERVADLAECIGDL